jgi:hypothetical protein
MWNKVFLVFGRCKGERLETSCIDSKCTLDTVVCGHEIG